MSFASLAPVVSGVPVVVAFAGFGALLGPVLARAAQRVPGVAGGPARGALTSVLAGTAFGALAARLMPQPDTRYALPAFLALAAAGVVLAVVDLDTHRLPDAVTLPAYPVIALLLAGASVAVGSADGLARAVGGALASVVLYGVLCAIAPTGLGFGDVKLAGVLGLALGWLSWSTLVIGVVLGFAFGAAASLALVAAHRASMTTRVPFGPAMLAGALTAVVAGEWLAGHYLAL